MTVAAISNSTANLPPSVNGPQNFSDLVTAIRSGDLESAQSAYSDLTQSSASTTGPLAQAISQIGTALQSSDIGQAQQALAALQQQAKGAHHHGGHHHGGDKAQSAPAPSTPATTSASSQLLDVTA